MGPFAYYSPLWIGALFVLAVNDVLRERIVGPPWWQWSAVAAAAVLFGVQCQLLLIGAQGAFAQVLPVPRGRSIRGPGAVLGGWLLIAAFVCTLVSTLLLAEKTYLAGMVIGGAGAACFLIAAIAYVWNIPAAVTDFKADRIWGA